MVLLSQHGPDCTNNKRVVNPALFQNDRMYIHPFSVAFNLHRVARIQGTRGEKGRGSPIWSGAQSHKHSHATDNLAMLISWQYMALDWGGTLGTWRKALTHKENMQTLSIQDGSGNQMF